MSVVHHILERLICLIFQISFFFYVLKQCIVSDMFSFRYLSSILWLREAAAMMLGVTTSLSSTCCLILTELE